MPKPFVFNDENQANSYCSESTAGNNSLKRFKNNPAMLGSTTPPQVLGLWKTLTFDKAILLENQSLT
jgi:hypothetical protein